MFCFIKLLKLKVVVVVGFVVAVIGVFVTVLDLTVLSFVSVGLVVGLNVVVGFVLIVVAGFVFLVVVASVKKCC